MNRSARRIVRSLLAGLAIAACAIPLSGCLSAAIPDAVEVSPTPSTSPTDDPGGGDPLPDDTLTFEAGADLASDSRAEWADGLLSDEGWDYSLPDDGAGTWGYTTVDGSCTATFWQGTVSDLNADDDRGASDAILAITLGLRLDEVTPYAVDGRLSYQTPGNLGLDSRVISFTDEQGDYYVAARGFTGPRLGFSVIVDCETGAGRATVDEVLGANAIVVTP